MLSPICKGVILQASQLFMKSLIIVTALLCLALCIKSDASYIKADGRPLNIGHRGLASIMPENTLESFSAAMYQGADFIELDVVYTKEKYPLVMHDPFLTRITNIKNLSQFSTRYSTRAYNGVNKTDWWTDEFSLGELKTIKIKQAQAPGRLTIFDYLFTFPTLDEVVQMVINFNQQHKGSRNPDKRPVGILIEAKDSQMYRDMYGLEIGETILETLRKYKIDNIENATKYCPIYLHSFDYGTVKYWAANSELPRNYLLFSGTQYDLSDIARYATGIGFQDSIVWDYKNKKPFTVHTDTQAHGMLVHVWTFKDDELIFNATSALEAYKIGQDILKLDGIITEFCDVYAPVAQLLKKTQRNIQCDH